MNIETAKSLDISELKSEYRKYLRQLGLGENTVSTSSNDAFYLWKNFSKEFFWDKILSDNFEVDYKAAMLSALRTHSKGNPQITFTTLHSTA